MKKSGSDISIDVFMQSMEERFGEKFNKNRIVENSVHHLTAIPAAAQAFVLAYCLRNSHQPHLILAKNVKAQEELASDLEGWNVPVSFFPQIEPTVTGALPDQELAAERLAVLGKLDSTFTGNILATTTGSQQRLPSPDQIRSERLTLKKGEEYNREDLIEKLIAAGYQREVQVQERGTLSVRGAVVDLFPWDASQPIRSEWMGNELVSLREFDPIEQRSIRDLTEVSIILAGASLHFDEETSKAASSLLDYLPTSVVIFNLDETAVDSSVENEKWTAENDLQQSLEFYAHDFLHAPRGDFIGQERRRDLFLDHLRDWLKEEWEIVIFCNNAAEQKRLGEIIAEAQIDLTKLQFILRPLLRGFTWPQGRLVVLSDSEIFGRYQTLRALRKQERLTALRSQQTALDFNDISEGDYVVHLHHGIAFYRGLQKMANKDGNQIEVLVLEFAEQGKLYVPMEQAFLVSKYIGVGKRIPKLYSLGGVHWEKAKISAHKAAMDYAAELLKVHAERNAMPGHAFSHDTPWQKEFEEAFIYKETADQLEAILDTKLDMESTRPMDRLICGDVGFGKTEVAIRAIFKAVMDGKQVAFLVPTTVLAQQHFKTLCERFADFPIRVDVLSRFRTVGEQKKVVQALASGGVDVVIGTHRLISKDIIFRNLGLVVVDEEQRFGVLQKEKFKQRFRLVDVLTLSATPIPRTLYLALTGARDLSTIETPPVNRYPVETIISPYDERIIREAIQRELARNGQVYFLHNRVGSIHQMAEKLRSLLPEAKIEVGHGQMDENELEETMSRFVAGEIDVLLSTTIIESGLDIPNANTILIDRADRFGLADLYQLRGRVGRAQHKAYAYLFLPRHLMSVTESRKRVNAIRQYSQLGAGFKIAMRDLEIRGAGSILGTAQSGHITAVGFDLYCQLLKMAVSQIKGEKAGRWIECKMNLDFIKLQETDEVGAAAYIPRNYMSESKNRIEAYRRLAELRSLEELEKLKLEWRDRFGPFPSPLNFLCLTAEIRLRAATLEIIEVETKEEKLILKKRNNDFVMTGKKFPRLTAREATSKLREINKWITSLSQADLRST